MASKFDPLKDYLAAQIGPELTLTFEQIESLVGTLPKSARDYSAYWDPSRTHSITHAYLKAGWIKVSVVPNVGVLKLKRDPREATATLKRHGIS